MSGLVVQERHLQEMPLRPVGPFLPQHVDYGGLNRNEVGSPLPGWDVLLDPIQRLPECVLVPVLHLLQGHAAIVMEAVEPLLNPTGHMVLRVRCQPHAVRLWKLPLTTHPGGYWFPRVRRVETLGPQAVQPTHPIPLTGGGEEPEVLLRGFPVVIHVVLLGNVLQWENHEGEGRELIGKSEMQHVLQGLTLMPVLHRPKPISPDGLPDIPATRGKVEQAVYPASLVPDCRRIREVGSLVGWVLVSEPKPPTYAGLIPAPASSLLHPLPPGCPSPGVLVPPVAGLLRLVLVKRLREWKRPLVADQGRVTTSRLCPHGGLSWKPFDTLPCRRRCRGRWLL